jgi:hypothetical protein
MPNASIAMSFTSAQTLFKEAPPDIQKLARDVLRDERSVMHLRRRSDIHQRLYEHVKRVIK